MSYTTFISAEEAKEGINNANFLFIDCSYSLLDKNWGLEQYHQSHIPGAVYADLHKDLSSEVIPGKTSRHPLPGKERLTDLFSDWGVDESIQVVVYDIQSGAMAAARLWWLLKWSGHENVAVLAGGKKSWEKHGLPLSTGKTNTIPRIFSPHFNDDMLVSADDVLDKINQENTCIVDSRTSDRFRGENETIDPVAGHIPNAISKPFNALLNEDGIIDQSVNIEEFFKDIDKPEKVFYCGSGVTAAFNLLVFAHAYGSIPKLYAGSWSEWITDKNRPVQ